MFARMTLTEARNIAVQQLTAVTEPGEAQAIAEELLHYVSGIKKNDRARSQMFDLSEEKINLFYSKLNRIVAGEPMQYVLEEAWFFDLKLKVSPAVLIPRPETEELVEWIISYCRFPIEKLDILEMGTGSGCIAIALKKRLRKATVTAIDISKDALAIAEENARTLGIDTKFLQGDLFDKESWSFWPSFSILVSNPPYIPLADQLTMEQRVIAHEPSLALFVPDEDPLCYYSALGNLLLEKGLPGAQLFCEMNAELATTTQNLFIEMGLHTELKKDMQGKDRMIRVWR